MEAAVTRYVPEKIAQHLTADVADEILRHCESTACVPVDLNLSSFLQSPLPRHDIEDSRSAGPCEGRGSSDAVHDLIQSDYTKPFTTPLSAIKSALTNTSQDDGPFQPIVQNIEGAVLFADISGYTAISEYINSSKGTDEKLAVVLNAYFQRLIKLIQSSQGCIIRFLGDAMLVIFTNDTVGHNTTSSNLIAPSPQASTPSSTASIHSTTQLDTPREPKREEMSILTRRALECGLQIKKHMSGFSLDTLFDDGVPSSLSTHSSLSPDLQLSIRANFDDPDGSSAQKVDKNMKLDIKIGVGVGSMRLLHLGAGFGRMEYVLVGDPLIQSFNAEHKIDKPQGPSVMASPQAWALSGEKFFKLHRLVFPDAKTDSIEDDFVDLGGIPPSSPSNAISTISKKTFKKGSKAPEQQQQLQTSAPIDQRNAFALIEGCISSVRAGAGGNRAITFGHQSTLRPFNTTMFQSYSENSSKAMKCYLPQSIVPYIDTNLDTSKFGEIREVTVLFISTGIHDAESFGTGDFQQLLFLRQILATIQASIIWFGGEINKFMLDDKGSTVVAVFGLSPKAHENDPLRGVLAALSVVHALRLLPFKGKYLNPAIGITTGRAFCGVVGNKRKEYTILGDIVNLSARLMQRAIIDMKGYEDRAQQKDVMSIICCANTTALSLSAISYKPTEPLTIKGKQHALIAYSPYAVTYNRLYPTLGLAMNKMIRNAPAMLWNGTTLLLNPHGYSVHSNVTGPALQLSQMNRSGTDRVSGHRGSLGEIMPLGPPSSARGSFQTGGALISAAADIDRVTIVNRLFPTSATVGPFQGVFSINLNNYQEFSLVGAHAHSHTSQLISTFPTYLHPAGKQVSIKDSDSDGSCRANSTNSTTHNSAVDASQSPLFHTANDFSARRNSSLVHALPNTNLLANMQSYDNERESVGATCTKPLLVVTTLGVGCAAGGYLTSPYAIHPLNTATNPNTYQAFISTTQPDLLYTRTMSSLPEHPVLLCPIAHEVANKRPPSNVMSFRNVGGSQPSNAPRGSIAGQEISLIRPSTLSPGGRELSTISKLRPTLVGKSTALSPIQNSLMNAAAGASFDPTLVSTNPSDMGHRASYLATPLQYLYGYNFLRAIPYYLMNNRSTYEVEQGLLITPQQFHQTGSGAFFRGNNTSMVHVEQDGETYLSLSPSNDALQTSNNCNYDDLATNGTNCSFKSITSQPGMNQVKKRSVNDIVVSNTVSPIQDSRHLQGIPPLQPGTFGDHVYSDKVSPNHITTAPMHIYPANKPLLANFTKLQKIAVYLSTDIIESRPKDQSFTLMNSPYQAYIPAESDNKPLYEINKGTYVHLSLLQLLKYQVDTVGKLIAFVAHLLGVPTSPDAAADKNRLTPKVSPIAHLSLHLTYSQFNSKAIQRLGADDPLTLVRYKTQIHTQPLELQHTLPLLALSPLLGLQNSRTALLSQPRGSTGALAFFTNNMISLQLDYIVGYKYTPKQMKDPNNYQQHHEQRYLSHARDRVVNLMLQHSYNPIQEYAPSSMMVDANGQPVSPSLDTNGTSAISSTDGNCYTPSVAYSSSNTSQFRTDIHFTIPGLDNMYFDQDDTPSSGDRQQLFTPTTATITNKARGKTGQHVKKSLAHRKWSLTNGSIDYVQFPLSYLTPLFTTNYIEQPKRTKGLVVMVEAAQGLGKSLLLHTLKNELICPTVTAVASDLDGRPYSLIGSVVWQLLEQDTSVYETLYNLIETFYPQLLPTLPQQTHKPNSCESEDGEYSYSGSRTHSINSDGPKGGFSFFSGPKAHQAASMSPTTSALPPPLPESKFPLPAGSATFSQSLCAPGGSLNPSTGKQGDSSLIIQQFSNSSTSGPKQSQSIGALSTYSSPADHHSHHSTMESPRAHINNSVMKGGFSSNLASIPSFAGDVNSFCLDTTVTDSLSPTEPNQSVMVPTSQHNLVITPADTLTHMVEPSLLTEEFVGADAVTMINNATMIRQLVLSARIIDIFTKRPEIITFTPSSYRLFKELTVNVPSEYKAMLSETIPYSITLNSHNIHIFLPLLNVVLPELRFDHNPVSYFILRHYAPVFIPEVGYPVPTPLTGYDENVSHRLRGKYEQNNIICVNGTDYTRYDYHCIIHNVISMMLYSFIAFWTYHSPVPAHFDLFRSQLEDFQPIEEPQDISPSSKAEQKRQYKEHKEIILNSTAPVPVLNLITPQPLFVQTTEANANSSCSDTSDDESVLHLPLSLQTTKPSPPLLHVHENSQEAPPLIPPVPPTTPLSGGPPPLPSQLRSPIPRVSTSEVQPHMIVQPPTTRRVETPMNIKVQKTLAQSDINFDIITQYYAHYHHVKRSNNGYKLDFTALPAPPTLVKANISTPVPFPHEAKTSRKNSKLDDSEDSEDSIGLPSSTSVAFDSGRDLTMPRKISGKDSYAPSTHHSTGGVNVNYTNTHGLCIMVDNGHNMDEYSWDLLSKLPFFCVNSTLIIATRQVQHYSLGTHRPRYDMAVGTYLPPPGYCEIINDPQTCHIRLGPRHFFTTQSLFAHILLNHAIKKSLEGVLSYMRSHNQHLENSTAHSKLHSQNLNYSLAEAQKQGDFSSSQSSLGQLTSSQSLVTSMSQTLPSGGQSLAPSPPMIGSSQALTAAQLTAMAAGASQQATIKRVTVNVPYSQYGADMVVDKKEGGDIIDNISIQVDVCDITVASQDNIAKQTNQFSQFLFYLNTFNGNPQLIREIVGILRDPMINGVKLRQQEKFEINEQLFSNYPRNKIIISHLNSSTHVFETNPIPALLKAQIASAIDRISPFQVILLKVATLIGHCFSFDLIIRTILWSNRTSNAKNANSPLQTQNTGQNSSTANLFGDVVNQAALNVNNSNATTVTDRSLINQFYCNTWAIICKEFRELIKLGLFDEIPQHSTKFEHLLKTNPYIVSAYDTEPMIYVKARDPDNLFKDFVESVLVAERGGRKDGEQPSDSNNPSTPQQQQQQQHSQAQSPQQQQSQTSPKNDKPSNASGVTDQMVIQHANMMQPYSFQRQPMEYLYTFKNGFLREFLHQRILNDDKKSWENLIHQVTQQYIDKNKKLNTGQNADQKVNLLPFNPTAITFRQTKLGITASTPFIKGTHDKQTLEPICLYHRDRLLPKEKVLEHLSQQPTIAEFSLLMHSNPYGKVEFHAPVSVLKYSMLDKLLSYYNNIKTDGPQSLSSTANNVDRNQSILLEGDESASLGHESNSFVEYNDRISGQSEANITHSNSMTNTEQKTLDFSTLPQDLYDQCINMENYKDKYLVLHQHAITIWNDLDEFAAFMAHVVIQEYLLDQLHAHIQKYNYNLTQHANLYVVGPTMVTVPILGSSNEIPSEPLLNFNKSKLYNSYYDPRTGQYNGNENQNAFERTVHGHLQRLSILAQAKRTKVQNALHLHQQQAPLQQPNAQSVTGASTAKKDSSVDTNIPTFYSPFAQYPRVNHKDKHSNVPKNLDLSDYRQLFDLKLLQPSVVIPLSTSDIIHQENVTLPYADNDVSALPVVEDDVLACLPAVNEVDRAVVISTPQQRPTYFNFSNNITNTSANNGNLTGYALDEAYGFNQSTITSQLVALKAKIWIKRGNLFHTDDISAINTYFYILFRPNITTPTPHGSLHSTSSSSAPFNPNHYSTQTGSHFSGLFHVIKPKTQSIINFEQSKSMSSDRVREVIKLESRQTDIRNIYDDHNRRDMENDFKLSITNFSPNQALLTTHVFCYKNDGAILGSRWKERTVILFNGSLQFRYYDPPAAPKTSRHGKNEPPPPPPQQKIQPNIVTSPTLNKGNSSKSHNESKNNPNAISATPDPYDNNSVRVANDTFDLALPPTQRHLTNIAQLTKEAASSQPLQVFSLLVGPIICTIPPHEKYKTRQTFPLEITAELWWKKGEVKWKQRQFVLAFTTAEERKIWLTAIQTLSFSNTIDWYVKRHHSQIFAATQPINYHFDGIINNTMAQNSTNISHNNNNLHTSRPGTVVLRGRTQSIANINPAMLPPPATPNVTSGKHPVFLPPMTPMIQNQFVRRGSQSHLSPVMQPNQNEPQVIISPTIILPLNTHSGGNPLNNPPTDKSLHSGLIYLSLSESWDTDRVDVYSTFCREDHAAKMAAQASSAQSQKSQSGFAPRTIPPPPPGTVVITHDCCDETVCSCDLIITTSQPRVAGELTIVLSTTSSTSTQLPDNIFFNMTDYISDDGVPVVNSGKDGLLSRIEFKSTKIPNSDSCPEVVGVGGSPYLNVDRCSGSADIHSDEDFDDGMELSEIDSLSIKSLCQPSDLSFSESVCVLSCTTLDTTPLPKDTPSLPVPTPIPIPFHAVPVPEPAKVDDVTVCPTCGHLSIHAISCPYFLLIVADVKKQEEQMLLATQELNSPILHQQVVIVPGELGNAKASGESHDDNDEGYDHYDAGEIDGPVEAPHAMKKSRRLRDVKNGKRKVMIAGLYQRMTQERKQNLVKSHENRMKRNKVVISLLETTATVIKHTEILAAHMQQQVDILNNELSARPQTPHVINAVAELTGSLDVLQTELRKAVKSVPKTLKEYGLEGLLHQNHCKPHCTEQMNKKQKMSEEAVRLNGIIHEIRKMNDDLSTQYYGGDLDEESNTPDENAILTPQEDATNSNAPKILGKKTTPVSRHRPVKTQQLYSRRTHRRRTEASISPAHIPDDNTPASNPLLSTPSPKAGPPPLPHATPQAAQASKSPLPQATPTASLMENTVNLIQQKRTRVDSRPPSTASETDHSNGTSNHGMRAQPVSQKPAPREVSIVRSRQRPMLETQSSVVSTTPVEELKRPATPTASVNSRTTNHSTKRTQRQRSHGSNADTLSQTNHTHFTTNQANSSADPAPAANVAIKSFGAEGLEAPYQQWLLSSYTQELQQTNTSKPEAQNEIMSTNIDHQPALGRQATLSRQKTISTNHTPEKSTNGYCNAIPRSSSCVTGNNAFVSQRLHSDIDDSDDDVEADSDQDGDILLNQHPTNPATILDSNFKNARNQNTSVQKPFTLAKNNMDVLQLTPEEELQLKIDELSSPAQYGFKDEDLADYLDPVRRISRFQLPHDELYHTVLEQTKIIFEEAKQAWQNDYEQYAQHEEQLQKSYQEYLESTANVNTPSGEPKPSDQLSYANISRDVTPILHNGIAKPLLTWSYSTFDVHPSELLLNIVRMLAAFDIPRQFQVDPTKLSSFLCAVYHCYHDNPYHSVRHAVDVTCTVWTFLTLGHAAQLMSNLERFALIIASFCHDIDHPLINNMYCINTRSSYALMSNDQSVLESHHARATWMLLQKPQYNIINRLTISEYDEFRKISVMSILATDMTQHFSLVDRFDKLLTRLTEMKNNAPSRAQLSCEIYNNQADFIAWLQAQQSSIQQQNKSIMLNSAFPTGPNPTLALVQSSGVNHNSSKRPSSSQAPSPAQQQQQQQQQQRKGPKVHIGAPMTKDTQPVPQPTPAATTTPSDSTTNNTTPIATTAPPPTTRMHRRASVVLTPSRENCLVQVSYTMMSGNSGNQSPPSESDNDMSGIGIQTVPQPLSIPQGHISHHSISTPLSAAGAHHPDSFADNNTLTSHTHADYECSASTTSTIGHLQPLGANYNSLFTFFNSSLPLTSDLPLYAFVRRISFTDRVLIIQLLLHAADISNPTKPWHQSKRWADSVCNEFLIQGDLERYYGLNISPNCDRRETNLAMLNVSFIDFVVAPLFHQLYRLLPDFKVLCHQMSSNRSTWCALYTTFLDSTLIRLNAIYTLKTVEELVRNNNILDLAKLKSSITSDLLLKISDNIDELQDSRALSRKETLDELAKVNISLTHDDNIQYCSMFPFVAPPIPPPLSNEYMSQCFKRLANPYILPSRNVIGKDKPIYVYNPGSIVNLYPEDQDTTNPKTTTSQLFFALPLATVNPDRNYWSEEAGKWATRKNTYDNKYGGAAGNHHLVTNLQADFAAFTQSLKDTLFVHVQHIIEGAECDDANASTCSAISQNNAPLGLLLDIPASHSAPSQMSTPIASGSSPSLSKMDGPKSHFTHRVSAVPSVPTIEASPQHSTNSGAAELQKTPEPSTSSKKNTHQLTEQQAATSPQPEAIPEHKHDKKSKKDKMVNNTTLLSSQSSPATSIASPGFTEKKVGKKDKKSKK